MYGLNLEPKNIDFNSIFDLHFLSAVRPNGTLHRGELSAQASADGQTVTVTPFIKMANSNNWDEELTGLQGLTVPV